MEWDVIVLVQCCIAWSISTIASHEMLATALYHSCYKCWLLWPMIYMRWASSYALHVLMQALIEDQAACVIHLCASGWPVCEHLDELLTTLAHQYQHTCFCRLRVPTPLVKSSSTAPNGVPVGPLKITHGLPSLVVTQQGVIVGEAPVVRFGGAADLIEEEVVGYLRRIGALRSANSSSKGGMHNSKSNVEDEDSCGEQEDEQEQVSGQI